MKPAQHQDVNHLRVVVGFEALASIVTKYEIYEIICEHKYQLNKLELEQVISEITHVVISQLEALSGIMDAVIPYVKLHFFSIDKTRRYIEITWFGQMKEILRQTTSFEPIPITSNHLPYVLEFEHDFGVAYERVKPEYQKVFKSCDQLPPCDFMMRKKRPCMTLQSREDKFIGNKKIQERILQHLSKYDHFECFGKKKPMCPHHINNNKCIHFENILDNKNTIDGNLCTIDKKYSQLL